MDNIQSIRTKIRQLQQYRFERCSRPDIKVACILDTFSYECFKYECQLVQLEPNTWKKQLTEINPEFLFVESAWKGLDDKWKKEIVDIQKNPKSKIKDIISYCKTNKIKTVFWNKEDPPNYARFVHTAKLFEYIFTSEENCVKKYKNDVTHDRIYVLPFAAQPAIHNPIHSSYKDKENVAFTGSWRGDRYPERQVDTHIVLKPAKEFGLTIFDRNYKFNVPKYRFPKQYQPHVVGSLNYNDMVLAYKLFKVFLNVNSVRNSSTMFSRRVFEILASGTNIVSTYSKGIVEMFKGIVLITLSEEETRNHISRLIHDPEYSQRLCLLGVREIHSKHLYKHRFKYILDKIGMKHQEEQKEGVSIITCANTPKCIDQLLINYANQSWENKELIVILNKDSDLQYFREKAKNVPNVSMYQLSGEKSLGECRKWAIEKTKYNYISFFEDRHYYAPHFLTDLMHTFDYSNADIVGKYSYYSYLKSKNTLELRFPDRENQFVDLLCDSAMIVKKDVFQHVQFPAKSIAADISFFKECSDKGFKLYSADKYNHIQNYPIVASTDNYISFITV